ncbi:glycosyltransferase family 25 protein [Plesiomonas shigelloides]|uniref:glycosyltransferase family 25 protein n=1 Tax=Plesiomonas shigelloides TaxID=703 RepID=UPI00351D4DF0
MQPTILVISLPGSKRRDNVINRLVGYGLNFSFIDGVNGNLINLNAPEVPIDVSYCKTHWGHSINNGEIGCAMSHIKCYEYIVKNNIPEAIILEDDFHLDENFKQIISAIQEKAPKRREITFLFHGKAKGWPIKRKLYNEFNLVRYRYPSKKSKRAIIGAVAYMLTLDGAKKLLNIAYPIRMPADYLTGYIQRNKLHAYGVEPCCVSITNVPSEIDSISKRNYGTHIENE